VEEGGRIDTQIITALRQPRGVTETHSPGLTFLDFAPGDLTMGKEIDDVCFDPAVSRNMPIGAACSGIAYLPGVRLCDTK